jgi:hypothetical protein
MCREKWIDLAEKVEMGLTWIDHDTIEQPVEEVEVRTSLNLLSIYISAHLLKGTVSRDFRPSVFFIKQSPLGP